MSLLSSFITDQLIKSIEQEFVNREPDIQAAIIDEFQTFLDQGAAWIKSKSTPTQTTGE